MPEGLSIQIGADVNGAIAGLQQMGLSISQAEKRFTELIDTTGDFDKALVQLAREGGVSINFLEKEIKDFKKAFADSTDPAQAKKFGDALQILQIRQKELINSGLSLSSTEEKITKAHAGHTVATQRLSASLLGLSRVFDALPPELVHLTHGFDQIVNSYERVADGTESTKQAVTKFAGVLGQAGLGIAIGLAAGFLATYVQELFEASEASKKAAAAQEDLKKSFENIIGGVAKEQTQVISLIAVLKNETETRQRRLAAIKELQQIQPEIFKGLKLEGDAVVGLDAAYKAYVENLKTVIAAKLIQAQIEQKITELLKLQGIAATKAQLEGAKAVGKILDNINASKKLPDQIKIPTIGEKLVEENERNIKKLESDIDGLAERLQEFSKGIDVKIPTDKIKKIFEPIKVGLIDGLNDIVRTVELNPSKLSLPFQVALDEKKFSLAFSSVNEELRAKLNEFALKASSVPTVIKQQIQVDPNIIIPAGIRKEIEDHLKAISAAPGTFKVEIDADAKVKININSKQIFEDLAKEINTALVAGANNAFAGIGEALGAALSNNLKFDALKTVVNGLSGILADVGKALIKAGVLLLGLQNAIKKIASNPALAIGLGIALIALSKVLQNSISTAAARERGGPVQKGFAYTVNERGQEAFLSNSGKLSMIEGGIQTFKPWESGKILPAAIAKAFAQRFNMPRFESGGLITGPTFGLLGEGAGISRFNPEVIAPLSTLKGLLGFGGQEPQPIILAARIKNRDLLLGGARETRFQRRNT